MPGDIPTERFHVLEELVANDTEILQRAFDRMLQREVLLERPGPGVRVILQKSSDQTRILREARALARLRHHGIIRLLDVLPEDGTTLVLEPVQGETLAQRLVREPKLPPEEVRRIGIEVCQALEVVHGAGIVHRGIAEHAVIQRPDGSVCLSGFVFAKFGGHEITLSSSLDYRAGEPRSGPAAPAALPRHPAPEQIAGEVAGPRSDLFGLGCVLYRCLTGVTAFDDVRNETWTAAADPRDMAPHLPRDLSAAILRCLARSPFGRFPSASDLRAALEAGQPRTAQGPGRVLRKSTMLVGAAGLIAAVSSLWALGRPAPGDARGESIASRHAERAGGYSRRYDKSRAVIIGIDRHQSPGSFLVLSNAERDARAVAAGLASLADWDPGDVKLLLGEDATKDAITDAIGDAARESGLNDRLLIYYAGHGIAHEKSEMIGWIAPFDALPRREDPNHKKWIYFNTLALVFDESSAKHILIVLDCCFSGRIVRKTMRDAGEQIYREAFLERPAHVVMTSASPRKASPDGIPGKHSPFTQGFLDALSSRSTGAMTTSEMYADILKHILSDPDKSQRIPPVIDRAAGGGEGGEFVFFLKRR
jgi:hypothetical protein